MASIIFVADGIVDTVAYGKLPSPMLISATIVEVVLVVRPAEEAEDVDGKLVRALDGKEVELLCDVDEKVEAFELP